MAPPLLNEYKLSFAFQRFFKNASGGPGFAPRDSGYLNSILLVVFSLISFFLPLALAIILQSIIGQQQIITSLVFGGIVVGLHTLTYVGAVIYHSRNTFSFDQNDGKSLGFLQDSEPPLDGNPFGDAFKYLFVKDKDSRSSILGQALKTVVASVCLGVFSYYLTPNFFMDRFGSSYMGAYIIVWISICMSHWPLFCKKPVEPNTYHPEDIFGFDVYSRLFHISVLVILLIIETFVPQILYIDQAISWVLLLLPIIWMLGIFPTLRISLAVGLERVNTCLLSGSPTLNNLQLWILLLLRILLGIVVPLLFFNKQYPVIALIVSTGSATLLASRIIPDFILKRTFSSKSAHILGTEPSLNQFKKSWPSLYLSIRIAVTIGLGILFCLVNFNTSDHPWKSSISLLVVIFTLLLKATREIQQAHIPSILPIFLNPIYFYWKNSILVKEIGFLHSVCLIPLYIITQSYIFISLIPTSTLLYTTPDLHLLDFWRIVMIFRSFSSIAHYPEGAGTDCCLTMLLYQLSIIQSTSPFSIWWNGLDFGTQLFLVHVSKMFLLRLVEKWVFWIIALKHFLFNKKERHPTWKWWLVPILVVSPITIVISSILDMPSSPYLGLPFLVLAFPRPQRFWEPMTNEYVSGKDVPLYKSLAPTLIKEISKYISEGKIPDLNAGDVFLARSDSRILIIRAIETWFEGMTTLITATELEPTSCHALEGTAVDEVLDKTLDQYHKSWTNQFLLNTLQPVGVLKAKGYVESQQITTGILTNTTYTTTFPPLFFKVLIFHFMKKMDLNQLVSFRSAPVNPALLTQVKMIFPHSWFELVKQHCNEYQSTTKSMTVGRIEALNETIINVLQTAFIVMLGTTPGSNSTQLYLSVLFDLYRGKLCYTVQQELRLWFQNGARKGFRVACVEALRYTFKYLYDASVLQEPIEDMLELHTSLNEMTSQWIATVDPGQQLIDDPTDPEGEIEQGLSNGIKGVFQLFLKKQGEPLRVRMLVHSDNCQVKIAKINKEALQGVWANLTYELLYLTNDDDERFSIQAHQLLMRNLSVQVASPPFGYPLWVSPAQVNTCISLPLGSPRPKKKRLSQAQLKKISPEHIKSNPKLNLYKIQPITDEDIVL